MFLSKEMPQAVGLVCTVCASVMQKTDCIPSAVGLPEMYVFRCACCGWVKTADATALENAKAVA